MTIVITENTVKNRDAYLELAKAFAADARKDKGCQAMDVCVHPEQEDCVVFVSKWEQKEDFKEHVAGPSFGKHIPAMGEYYVSGKDTFLEVAE